MSQRELAKELGMSLGKTNYCIRAVIGEGWVKVRNFRNSANKAAYLYQLHPAASRPRVRSPAASSTESSKNTSAWNKKSSNSVPK